MNEQLYGSIGDCFIRGDISAAMEIMAAHEELMPLYEQYADIFLQENYLCYDLPGHLNEALLAYQQYFRDAFYLKVDASQAEDALLHRLQTLLNVPTKDEGSIGQAVEAAFRDAGFHALTGRTNGCFGPYVWKTTIPTTYTVELPEGRCEYTVNILKDFVFRSWMAYLTFGTHGTGGWTSPDGTINCVESAYDFESERFRVSLLKHEAQHVQDLQRWPDMPSWLLEYRAKLVELIYTEQTNLLAKFISEADPSRKNDSHAVAACRIAEEMADYVDRPIAEIQQKAMELYTAAKNRA